MDVFDLHAQLIDDYRGFTVDDADYIMETFPIVKRKDEAAHGEYRTKLLILEAYDRLAG